MSKKRKPSAKKAKPVTGEYEVGYGKPPITTRFAPGQSGNPGGRKKGLRNYETLVREVFEAEIDVTENGRRTKCTVAKALLLTLVQGGLKDRDFRAIARALELYERHADKGEDETSEALPQQDRDIIHRALEGEPPCGDGEHDEDEDEDEDHGEREHVDNDDNDNDDNDNGEDEHRDDEHGDDEYDGDDGGRP